MKKETILIPLTIAIIIISLLFINKKCEDNKQNKTDIKLLTGLLKDTLITIQHKDGSQTSIINLLSSTNADLLLQINSKDKTIQWLQSEVAKAKSEIKDGGSVTVIESNNEFADTIIPKITRNDSCNPIYIAENIDTLWVKWKVKASSEAVIVDIETKEKYSVVIGSEKIGLFKRKPIVEVTSYNPYTKIKNMRAFQVIDNSTNRKFSLGIQGGYGITLHGLSPYLGLGINFRLL